MPWFVYAIIAGLGIPLGISIWSDINKIIGGLITFIGCASLLILLFYTIKVPQYDRENPIDCVVRQHDTVDIAVLEGRPINLNREYGQDFEDGQKIRFLKSKDKYVWGLVIELSPSYKLEYER